MTSPQHPCVCHVSRTRQRALLCSPGSSGAMGDGRRFVQTGEGSAQVDLKWSHGWVLPSKAAPLGLCPMFLQTSCPRVGQRNRHSTSRHGISIFSQLQAAVEQSQQPGSLSPKPAGTEGVTDEMTSITAREGEHKLSSHFSPPSHSTFSGLTTLSLHI